MGFAIKVECRLKLLCNYNLKTSIVCICYKEIVHCLQHRPLVGAGDIHLVYFPSHITARDSVAM